MTTDGQIRIARIIAKDITNRGKVSGWECRVDDWDDFGGFNLICQFRNNSQIKSLRPAVNAIKRALWNYEGFVVTEYIDCPKRHYMQSQGRKIFLHYDRPYIKVSIIANEGAIL